MSDPRFPLLIIGASTRAAAFSACRAGYQPICLDAFADADLSAVAKVQAVQPYPDGFTEALESLPRCPLIYVGAMENYPHVLKDAQRLHHFCGNSPEVVAKVRDPQVVRRALEFFKTGIPAWRDSSNPPPADGTWMLKPVSSAGGRGVAVWDENGVHSPTLEIPHWFQQRIHGQACSALFLAPQGIGDVRFVGQTMQIMGDTARNAHEFSWCGNIGPLALPVNVENQVRRMGNLLKSQCGLTGLFGIDFIVDDKNVPWLTEVNPRYPASTEILEFATRQCLLPLHLSCFAADDQDEFLIPTSRWLPPKCEPVIGKMVLYAKQEIRFNAKFPVSKTAPFQLPVVADIPSAGTNIEAGQPVCTVFATATTIEECRQALLEKVAEAEQLIYSK